MFNDVLNKAGFTQSGYRFSKYKGQYLP